MGSYIRKDIYVRRIPPMPTILMTTISYRPKHFGYSQQAAAPLVWLPAWFGEVGAPRCPFMFAPRFCEQALKCTSYPPLPGWDVESNILFSQIIPRNTIRIPRSVSGPEGARLQRGRRPPYRAYRKIQHVDKPVNTLAVVNALAPEQANGEAREATV